MQRGLTKIGGIPAHFDFIDVEIWQREARSDGIDGLSSIMLHIRYAPDPVRTTVNILLAFRGFSTSLCFLSILISLNDSKLFHPVPRIRGRRLRQAHEVDWIFFFYPLFQHFPCFFAFWRSLAFMRLTGVAVVDWTGEWDGVSFFASAVIFDGLGVNHRVIGGGGHDFFKWWEKRDRGWGARYSFDFFPRLVSNSFFNFCNCWVSSQARITSVSFIAVAEGIVLLLTVSLGVSWSWGLFGSSLYPYKRHTIPLRPFSLFKASVFGGKWDGT